MLLQKHLQTTAELAETKKQLNIRKNELLDTKTKLQITEAKLRESNDTIIISYPQPLAKVSLQVDDQEINSLFSSTFISIFINLFQPFQNFTSRIENLSSHMEVGKIYFHQQNIFFKLSLFRNNHEVFYVDHDTNINEKRNRPNTVFFNDNFVLLECPSSFYDFNELRNNPFTVNDNFELLDYSPFYDLHIEITNFDYEDSELFLVSRKRQQKHPLKYGYHGNTNILWNDFKNEKNEVIFYLKKK